MSRNLLSSHCVLCAQVVAPNGPTHPITRAEAGAYFEEYTATGLHVATATCACGARYLAWMSDDRNPLREDGLPRCLSWRSTFDDEPGPGDLPPLEGDAREACW